MMYRAICLVLLSVLVHAPVALASTGNRLALFIPDDTPFWNRVVLFARAATEDMGDELTVFDADADRLRMQRQFESALRGDRAFDAAIFPNFLQTASRFLEICAQEAVPCVLFNSGLQEPENGVGGQTDGSNPHWIAHLVPDDVGSSADMTEYLIRRAEQGASSEPVTMAAINGYRSDTPAIKRERGVRQVLERRPDVTFTQMFYTDWSAGEAKTRLSGLLQRYPRVDVVWSANYRITEGILSAMEEEGLTPGQDLLINSYDINPATLEQVADGRVTITAGGHYVEGAWSVILAHDYLGGAWPATDRPVFDTPLLLVNRNNVGVVRKALGRLEDNPDSLSRVDFTRYSRLENPNRKHYEFSLRDVLKRYQSNWAMAPRQGLFERSTTQ
ncbi:ABC transporter substrate-binding protein [Tamilnaduibacter salinus]|nr:ABC transporter substrate-binding protein [Tamilnaduibacter salinus]